MFSLIALKDPMDAILIFQCLHMIIVGIIFITTSKCFHNCNVKDIIKSMFLLFLTCFSSNSVIVSFLERKRGSTTFWTQFYFNLLVLVENIFLVFLPEFEQNLYEHLKIKNEKNESDRFSFLNEHIDVIFGIWFLGIFLQVILLFLIILKIDDLLNLSYKYMFSSLVLLLFLDIILHSNSSNGRGKWFRGTANALQNMVGHL